MIQFSAEKILLLHQFLMQETGGLDGLRDKALFESAIQSAFATFDGKELYPTKQEKAAQLGYSLVRNHAFLDGNKRIGVYVMLTFLDVNGVRLEYTDDDIVALGLGMANGMGYQEVLRWILEHMV